MNVNSAERVEGFPLQPKKMDETKKPKKEISALPLVLVLVRIF